MEAELSNLLGYNQQFFTNETALGAITQIVENGLFRFGERSLNAINIQTPDWVCGPFYTPSSSPG